MTDRELLELAAKAAGLNVKGEWADEDDKFTHLNIGKKFTNERMKWNPLTDDGDALRLAVDLKLDIKNYEDYVHVWWCQDFFATGQYFYGDPRKATRRAIVIAAAEIQLQKEREQ